MTKNTRTKIAVIEDDTSIKDLYEFKLKKEGFNVKTAADGVAGLKLVDDFRPDIILLDVLMPQKNGADMLEEMRSFDWAKKIRVIILTNISEAEIPPKLKSLKVDRFVVKAQYTPMEVVDIVKEVLAS